MMEDTSSGYLEILRSDDDWFVRRRAALALGGERPPGALEALEEALADRDADVRQAAVIALGRLGDERALEILARPMVLEDPSANIRWAAVKALGQLGSLSQVGVLTGALEDPEWIVRNEALLVISDFIRAVPDRMTVEERKSFIRLLTIPDEEVRRLVIDTLARRSTFGLQEMVEALHGKSRKVRSGVAEALGESRDPRSVLPLIEATRDQSGIVRAAAVKGLGKLGDHRAVEAVIVVLGGSYIPASKAAVEALVKLGERAVKPLCNALTYAISKNHRRNVIRALGGIRHPMAILPLLNCLSSTYYVVRTAAVDALSAYGEVVVDDLVAMVQVSNVQVDDLLNEVSHEKNKRLRLRAIRALGELKDARAIRPLREVMKEDDEEYHNTTQEALSKIGLAAWSRCGAVNALGNIESPAAVSALIEATGDYSEHVRGAACRALAKIGDAVSIPTLLKALERDENPMVRREAAKALRLIGAQSPAVVAALIRALEDVSWEVRMIATRALGRVNDPSPVTPLMKTLSDSSYSVRNSGAHALANLADFALPQLLEKAAGPDCDARSSSLQALSIYLGKDFRNDIEALSSAPPEERKELAEALRLKIREAEKAKRN